MRSQKNAQNHTSVGLFKCIYLRNYYRYNSEILRALLQIYGDHFVKISSNSEVVMLEAFVELTRNDPVTIRITTISTSQHFTTQSICSTSSSQQFPPTVLSSGKDALVFELSQAPNDFSS